MVNVKRVYEPPSRKDGTRILVERLWPRGISKERAAIDLWMKQVAPSAELRRWYGHDLSKWEEFRKRYWEELKRNKEAVALLKQQIRMGTVTFVYAARDVEHNSTVVLRQFLAKQRR
jgi:uncharacterized protein YeaO (DUF488 family)